MTAAVDTFKGYEYGLGSPVTHVEAATPDDAVELTNVSRSIKANGPSGLASLLFLDGTTSSEYLIQGVLYPYRIRRVNLAGTAAGLNITCHS